MPDCRVEFHEQGHAYLFNDAKFNGEMESNCNLLHDAMLTRAFGNPIVEVFATDNTAIAWMCNFNFSPDELPMAKGTYFDRAKWIDIARIYATNANPNAGWEKLDAYFKSFMQDDANNVSYNTGTDDLILRLSKAVGKDIRPLIHFWGIPPENPTALATKIANANLEPDPAIRAQLLHYKSIVPADNTAFRSFCTSWLNRQPLVTRGWLESSLAMQWDETLDTAEDYPDPSVRPTITTGSKYVEGCAADIRNRVDELVDLYFPNAMTPATMSFAIAPTALNATTVTMTATTVTGASPPVQYYFENTTNATSVVQRIDRSGKFWFSGCKCFCFL